VAERVRITDVSPRDGLQNEPGVVPSAAKARLIDLLASAGVDEVEATSFVAPGWIPQLADAEAVLTAVAAGGTRPVMSALVPNLKGLTRLVELQKTSGRRVISKVAFFTSATETFAKKNINATIAESIARLAEMMPAIGDHGFALRLYVSCAVACPFEGKVAPAAVRAVVDRLRAVAPGGEIDLADTIGVARPGDIEALLGVFRREECARMTLHLHDTFGGATGCVRTALGLGVRSFDCAAGGLGGCPYASTPGARAPGNIAAGALIAAVSEAGFETGVDPVRMAAASAFAREIVAKAAPA
jgi:hydroxymethylglutaryl-CoA lyase